MADEPIPLVPVTPLGVSSPTTPVNPAYVSPAMQLPEQDAASSSTTLPTHVFEALEAQGYTHGLAQALERNKRAFPLRIFVVDNSGSMAIRDGHRLLASASKNNVKFAECTRWAEMQQTVDYHAQLAALIESPTIFRLLNDPGRVNGPQQFSIAEQNHGRTVSSIQEELAIAQSTMVNSSPGGVTPLTRHVREIRESVVSMTPTLQRDGTKVVIVLATDGIPSNQGGVSDAAVKQEFVESLRSLEGLPVWIVVRLCTDEEEVVDFWNNMDNNLELSLEVLDDFSSEAQEVHEHNPWLNYALPIHRMREMGFYHRLFDLLDERALSKDELRDFCRVLFGDGKMDGVPDPQDNFDSFATSIGRLVDQEAKQWNPISKRVESWIDIRRLKKAYSSGWSFFWW